MNWFKLLAVLTNQIWKTIDNRILTLGTDRLYVQCEQCNYKFLPAKTTEQCPECGAQKLTHWPEY